MATSPEMLCCLCPPPFQQFLEAVTNMRFDEEPNYLKLISLFDNNIGSIASLRPIRIDGALKVSPWSKTLCLSYKSVCSFFYLLLHFSGIIGGSKTGKDSP